MKAQWESPSRTYPFNTGFITQDQRWHDIRTSGGTTSWATTPPARGGARRCRASPGPALGVAPGDGSTLAPSLWGPYRPGTEVTVTAWPKPGYAFETWVVDGKEPPGRTRRSGP
ncbi:InlB B-repeat-containing protein [Actinomycetota bacterium Odt1-20B]